MNKKDWTIKLEPKTINIIEWSRIETLKELLLLLEDLKLPIRIDVDHPNFCNIRRYLKEVKE